MIHIRIDDHADNSKRKFACGIGPDLPAGDTYWFDTKLANGAALLARLTRIAQMQPQPEVHIRADGRAAYDAIGRAVYACQQTGIERIGFITEPPAASP